MEESYIPKKIILESEEVFQFGFTDTSLPKIMVVKY